LKKGGQKGIFSPLEKDRNAIVFGRRLAAFATVVLFVVSPTLRESPAQEKLITIGSTVVREGFYADMSELYSRTGIVSDVALLTTCPRVVIPAQAGIQVRCGELAWIPAFAGMTEPRWASSFSSATSIFEGGHEEHEVVGAGFKPALTCNPSCPSCLRGEPESFNPASSMRRSPGR
jgi:hypothetical protein